MKVEYERARETRKLAGFEKCAKEIEGGPKVRCRIVHTEEKIRDGRRVPVDVSRPIVLSASWRHVWPEAPTVLEAFDSDGEPVIHELPARVFRALQPELVRVEEVHQLLQPIRQVPARA